MVSSTDLLMMSYINEFLPLALRYEDSCRYSFYVEDEEYDIGIRKFIST
ncbi:3710_t:CDS:2 [Funneliformis geosporum]|nr:3710_t:CDS:2 [Funneliformis geosporum]